MGNSHLRLALIALVLVSGCSERSEPRTASPTTDCSQTVDTTQVPLVMIVDAVAAGTTAEEAALSGSLRVEEVDWGLRPATAFEAIEDMTGGVAVQDLAPSQAATTTQWGLPDNVTVPVAPEVLCPR